MEHKKFPTEADIAEMKACGYDISTIEAARARLVLGYRANEIADEIRTAFAGVKLGGGMGLGEGACQDDYEVTAKTRAEFRAADEKEDWQAISIDTLVNLRDGLGYIDAEGLRFYLPSGGLVRQLGLPRLQPDRSGSPRKISPFHSGTASGRRAFSGVYER